MSHGWSDTIKTDIRTVLGSLLGTSKRRPKGLTAAKTTILSYFWYSRQLWGIIVWGFLRLMLSNSSHDVYFVDALPPSSSYNAAHPWPIEGHYATLWFPLQVVHAHLMFHRNINMRLWGVKMICETLFTILGQLIFLLQFKDFVWSSHGKRDVLICYGRHLVPKTVCVRSGWVCVKAERGCGFFENAKEECVFRICDLCCG